MFKRCLLSFAFFAGVVSLNACASKNDNPALDPLTEAYSLMDQGQNARAILILESEAARNPKDAETNVLLASAYLGKTGVDVYRIYDSFKDVLFDQSLSDKFWKALLDRSIAPPNGHSPIELLIDQVDRFLNLVREVVSFLNRFPKVEKEKWALIDQALEHLDAIEATRDISLYRVFIRIIYLKAFINLEIIGNPDFGNRQWACGLDLNHFRDGLAWIARNLSLATEDFRRVYPDQYSSLAIFSGTVTELYEGLNGLESETSPSATGTLTLQGRLREAFKCEPHPN
ncbi:hypothetical protein WDW37_01780 [Bdellovibrionota bacterium FG-1]